METNADTTPAVQRRAPGRVVELDALRGLAALAVVAFHYTTFYQQQIGHVAPLGFGFPAGNYGVHLFFLISGFVILMTLERTRSAGDFVLSRFSRLFPAYWAAILLTAAVVYSIGLPQQRLPAGDVLLNSTMLQRILGAEDLDGSYWTLEVELFFYAQMLVWFWLGLLGRIRWIVGLWLVSAFAYAQTEAHHAHFSYTVRELLILRHIPFFALGVLFYRLWTRPEAWRGDSLLIVATLAVIATSMQAPYFYAALVCTGIFALFVAGGLGWLRLRPLAFLGGISYTLYLLHQAIGFAVIHRLEHAGMPAPLAVLSTTLLAILIAWALSRMVERPAMAWLRGRWRARARTAAAGHGAGAPHAFALVDMAGQGEAGVAATGASTLPAFREPWRSRFAEAVLGGAAARDIHDSHGAGEYDTAPVACAGDGVTRDGMTHSGMTHSGMTHAVSQRFLERELTRVEMHLHSLCAPLARRLGPTARILDAGCGTGGSTVALALSPLAPSITVGFDASPEAVDAARLRGQGYGLVDSGADEGGLRFVHVEAGSRLPFADGAFDLVVCVSVLEFISTPEARRAFAAELLRVVRPGGHVYLATPNPLRPREYHSRRWFGDWRRVPGFPWSSTPRELRALFPGCRVESMVRDRLRTHPHLHRLAWLAPLAALLMPWQRVLVRKPGDARAM